MADNYLERRMDDYRSGRLAPKSRKPSATSLPADALVLRYPALRVLLRADALTPELVSLVKEKEENTAFNWRLAYIFRRLYNHHERDPITGAIENY